MVYTLPNGEIPKGLILTSVPYSSMNVDDKSLKNKIKTVLNKCSVQMPIENDWHGEEKTIRTVLDVQRLREEIPPIIVGKMTRKFHEINKVIIPIHETDKRTFTLHTIRFLPTLPGEVPAMGLATQTLMSKSSESVTMERVMETFIMEQGYLQTKEGVAEVLLQLDHVVGLICEKIAKITWQDMIQVAFDNRRRDPNRAMTSQMWRDKHIQDKDMTFAAHKSKSATITALNALKIDIYNKTKLEADAYIFPSNKSSLFVTNPLFSKMSHGGQIAADRIMDSQGNNTRGTGLYQEFQGMQPFVAPNLFDGTQTHFYCRRLVRTGKYTFLGLDAGDRVAGVSIYSQYSGNNEPIFKSDMLRATFGSIPFDSSTLSVEAMGKVLVATVVYELYRNNTTPDDPEVKQKADELDAFVRMLHAKEHPGKDTNKESDDYDEDDGYGGTAIPGSSDSIGIPASFSVPGEPNVEKKQVVYDFFANLPVFPHAVYTSFLKHANASKIFEILPDQYTQLTKDEDGVPISVSGDQDDAYPAVIENMKKHARRDKLKANESVFYLDESELSIPELGSMSLPSYIRERKTCKLVTPLVFFNTYQPLLLNPYGTDRASPVVVAVSGFNSAFGAVTKFLVAKSGDAANMSTTNSVAAEYATVFRNRAAFAAHPAFFLEESVCGSNASLIMASDHKQLRENHFLPRSDSFPCWYVMPIKRGTLQSGPLVPTLGKTPYDEMTDRPAFSDCDWFAAYTGLATCDKEYGIDKQLEEDCVAMSNFLTNTNYIDDDGRIIDTKFGSTAYGRDGEMPHAYDARRTGDGTFKPS